MLKFVEIDKNNLDFAEEVFHRIFSWMPETKAFTFMKSIDPKLLEEKIGEYQAVLNLVYDENDKAVGLEGIYIVPDDKTSAFMSWFGVVPEERRNHYGSEILRMHEELLRKKGYKFSRLYTEAENNDKTRKFYESQGYVSEPYYCPEDKLVKKGMLVVYSKALGDYPLIPWNNRNMNITAKETQFLSPEQLSNLDEYNKAVAKREHS